MKVGEMFPSKYLRASDLRGEEFTLEVERIRQDEIKDKKGDSTVKPVLCFRGARKGLVLNVTNANRIAMLLGSEDTDDWVGQSITLHTEYVAAFGETVEAIRVKMGSKPTPPEPSGDVQPDPFGDGPPHTDDDIPF